MLTSFDTKLNKILVTIALSETAPDHWLVKTKDGVVAGYFRVPLHEADFQSRNEYIKHITEVAALFSFVGGKPNIEAIRDTLPEKPTKGVTK